MKIALTGLGIIGKVHLNVINNSGENLVGVCDIDKSKLVNFRKDIIFTDYKKMIDITKPDIVHICTPHYLHKEMIIYALKSNVNVLCEKPICISLEELDEIEKTLLLSNSQLGVCYQHRYDPSVIFTKDYIKNKNIISTFGLLMWKRDKDYYNQALWRGTKKYEGGGVLINQAIHTIDLLQLLGTMPSKITAFIENVSLKEIVDVEDNAVVLSSDNKFCLVASNTANKDYPVEIKLQTETESIRICNNEVYINGNLFNCDKLDEIPGAKKVYGGGHSSLILDFYQCIKDNVKFPIDFYESSKSLKIVLAAYRSMGKEVIV
jgi:predicted dehydrogenase